MLAGDRITLRSWTETDLPFFGRLRNDVALQLALLSQPRPSTTTRVRQWLENRASGNDAVFFVIALHTPQADRPAAIDSSSVSETPQPIGFVEIRELHGLNRTGELGICLDPDHRGRGHGQAALQLIERYAREILGLRKLLLHVAATNSAAVSLYQKSGYRTAGRLEQHSFAGGSWHDVLIMEKLLNESQPTTAVTAAGSQESAVSRTTHASHGIPADHSAAVSVTGGRAAPISSVERRN